MSQEVEQHAITKGSFYLLTMLNNLMRQFISTTISMHSKHVYIIQSLLYSKNSKDARLSSEELVSVPLFINTASTSWT
jgi:hypothetical protein